jgi:hypothetical protein
LFLETASERSFNGEAGFEKVSTSQTDECPEVEGLIEDEPEF